MISTITVITYVVARHKKYADVYVVISIFELFVIYENVNNDSLVQEPDLVIIIIM